jgi:DHA1 family multidrug resistance protein-like MFS transporter
VAEPLPPATPVGGPERVTVRAIFADPRVRVIVGIVFVVMLGFGIVAPILPLYGRSFGVGYEAVGLLISAFALARLVADPVAGPLVDRFGERRTASVGVTVVGLSSFATGSAPSFPLAVVFRGLGGFGSAVLFAALYSYMLKIVPPDRIGRTMGIFYGTFNAGIIAGGPIGGLIERFTGLRGPLFVYGGLCVLSGFLCLRYVTNPSALPGARPADDSPGHEPWSVRRTARQVAGLFRMPAFVTLIVANMAAFWTFGGAFNTLVPLFGKDRLGMTPPAIGAVLALAFATEFAMLYPFGGLADRFGRRVVLVPSYAALAFSVALIPVSGSAVWLAVAMAGVGLASGASAVAPTAMLADVSPKEGAGTAVGVFRFAGDLGFFLGPLAVGWAATSFGFGTAFLVAAVPLAAVVALGLWAPETLPGRSGGAPAASRAPGSSRAATP